MNLLATQLLDGDYELDCPVCGYPIWVLGAEIVAGVTVTCSCCRSSVQLVDDESSLQTAADELNQLMQRALKGLFE